MATRMTINGIDTDSLVSGIKEFYENFDPDYEAYL